MVLSAIENALWDIAGQARGIPAHVLLGGAVHGALPVYGSGGPFTMSIPELVTQAADTRRRGLRGFKMRVNFFRYQPEVEAERVAAVREALGGHMALAIDAVQNYNPAPWSVKDAVRMLRMLEPFNLAWAEEMLPPLDPEPFAELRRATSTPISGGEGITTAAQFEQWLRAGAFDLAQPDATIIGGIGEARRACEAAAARNIPVAVHGGDQRRRWPPTFMWPSPRPTASGSSTPFSATRLSLSCSSSRLSFTTAMCSRQRPQDSASA